jgi:hypothetical protein
MRLKSMFAGARESAATGVSQKHPARRDQFVVTCLLGRRRKLNFAAL